MKKKIIKRVLTGMMILAVAVVGFVYVPDSVQAEGTSPVKYQEVKYSVMEDCFGNTAPECKLEDEADTNIGYLFAGWYKTADNTSPIDELTDVENATDDTIVYAKFVPSYLAGIACQVDTNESADQRNLRVVSLVDSTNYKSVGFNVYGRYDSDENGTNETEWLMYTYSSTTQNAAESTKVYSGLNDYSKGETPEVRTPASVFGQEAEGFYFTTVSITGIGKKTNPNTQVEYDFRDATMALKPYWITLDGTYVEGMGEFNRVNDYAANIVNVSVNLKNVTDIAAGMLNITVPQSFSYSEVDVEGGRVFEEMEISTNGSAIKCVGNVFELANVVETKKNDVYVNLRFTVGDITQLTRGATEFAVAIPTNGFCDINEVYNNGVEAWNVKY